MDVSELKIQVIFQLKDLKKLSSFVVFFNSQLKSSTWWIKLNSRVKQSVQDVTNTLHIEYRRSVVL